MRFEQILSQILDKIEVSLCHYSIEIDQLLAPVMIYKVVQLIPNVFPTVRHRVRKIKNFPDRKIFTAKTFRIKCVNLDIADFATNARKT